MITIRFHYVREFIDELRRLRGDLQLLSPIRLTNYLAPVPTTSLNKVMVVVTALTDDARVVLEVPCGYCSNNKKMDTHATKRVDAVHSQIMAICEELKIQSAGGIFTLEAK